MSWHPIFLTVETSPGVWMMRHKHDLEGFGRIELRRTNGGLRYKVTHRDKVIGWSTTLQVACEALHVAHEEYRARVYAGPPTGPRD